MSLACCRGSLEDPVFDVAWEDRRTNTSWLCLYVIERNGLRFTNVMLPDIKKRDHLGSVVCHCGCDALRHVHICAMIGTRT